MRTSKLKQESSIHGTILDWKYQTLGVNKVLLTNGKESKIFKTRGEMLLFINLI